MMPPPTTVLILQPPSPSPACLLLSLSLFMEFILRRCSVLVSSYTAGKHSHTLLCYKIRNVDTYHSRCQSAGQLSIDWKVFCSF